MIETHFHTLARTLEYAIEQCSNESLEEEGGIILNKNGIYLFIKIQNEAAGTPVATGLWVTNPVEFGRKVLHYKAAGWQLQSFHTHPSFSATPSSLDLGTLFTGYPVNYIWARKAGDLFGYVFERGAWHDFDPTDNDFTGQLAAKLASMASPGEVDPVLEAALDKQLATLDQQNKQNIAQLCTAGLMANPERVIQIGADNGKS